MDWLRELPGIVFWWGWFMVALLAGGALCATWWARRNAAAIGAQTPTGVPALSRGYRLAWGTTAGPAITAPLTGRPCVWWKAEVWESVRERDTSGKTAHVWRRIADEESDRPLLFGEGQSLAAVWPSGATIVSSPWSDWRGSDLPPEETSPPLATKGAPSAGVRHDIQGTFGPRFRYIERIIPLDTPFFVLGEVTRTDPDLYGKGDEDTDLFADDADDADEESMAGAGEDHEDRLDRPHRSRLAVSPTPDSLVAQDMARASWTIARAKGKPFLLSTEHPESVSAEQELAAKGGLVMGGLFTALAVFLLWVRLAG